MIADTMREPSGLSVRDVMRFVFGLPVDIPMQILERPMRLRWLRI